ncbi:hypothetical protein CO669_07595 [Bradyrhizobium sp. Y36]|uniref:hypothetical protein n=1 Tax=Bradyrhizobium sp. Y36 TaxID=2035447 RepID=UPI000BE79A2E|nr:hypothetical protein [Bradyrhizobium sp. Y36]PDT90830.1 hypothetical protein CO669_07595 [Bradyrhizobium sp. Y36]
MVEITQPSHVDAGNSVGGLPDRVAPAAPQGRISSGISAHQPAVPATVVADLHVGAKGAPAAHANGPLVPASAFVGPEGAASGAGAPATSRPSTLLDALKDFDDSFKAPATAQDRAAKLTSLLYFVDHRKTETDKVATRQIIAREMLSIDGRNKTGYLLEAIEALSPEQAKTAALPLVQVIGTMSDGAERKTYAGGLVITLNRLLADPSSDQAILGKAVSTAAPYAGLEKQVKEEIANLTSANLNANQNLKAGKTPKDMRDLEAGQRASMLKFIVRGGTPRDMQSAVNQLQRHLDLVPGIIAHLDPKEALIVLRRVASAIDQNQGSHRAELARAVRVGCVKYAATLDPSLQAPFKALGERLERDSK